MTYLERSETLLFVGNEVFDFWSDCHVTSSLLDATNGFQFSSPVFAGVNEPGKLTAKGLVEGAIVTIAIRLPSGQVVRQMQGRIDEVRFQASHGSGTTIHVQGRDHMGAIVDSDAMPSVAQSDSSYRDVILDALRPFGFAASDVLISNDANRSLLTGRAPAGTTLSTDAPQELSSLKIGQARPHAGESVYAYLERHAKRFGLLIWGTGDGKIVFGRPNYEQSPLYRFRLHNDFRGVENNVKHATRHRNVKHVPSEVHVFGKSKGNDWARTDVHAIVRDDYTTGLGFHRVHTVSDRNVRTNAEAEQRGRYELSVRKQHADVVHFTTSGFSQADSIYAVDTVADVEWPGAMASGGWYITRRTFTWSRGAGSETQVELVPKGSIALGQVPFSERAS